MTRSALKSFVLSIALCIAGAGAAAADAAVDAFVGQINATIGSISPGDPAGASSACTRLIRQSFDLDAMAPTASAGTWKRMNSAQRSAYRSGLARQAARDCASRSGEFAGQKMQFVGVRTGDGGDRFIAVKAKGRTLIWRVRGSGRLRAIDLTVNGRSMVNAAQREAKAILQRSGGDLQALIKSVGG